VNVAPAVAPDGTIYTVSRAHFNARDAYLVAVNTDLTPRWSASLRARFSDGCGVRAEQGGVLPPNGAVGGCRAGSRLGVDPMTNAPGSGSVADESTSSPVVAPDGSILYGAFTRYNYSRGHLMKFSPAGAFLAAYSYGWDLTPAIDVRDTSYSILIKDNHYEDTGSYCNVLSVCGTDPGEHSITRLRGDTLASEWSTRSPSGAEWCINAPAVDRDGKVFVHSEDGSLYVISRDGLIAKNLFLRQPQNAAYTPLSLDASGRVYAQNAGHFFVVGH
jgi:outer membrane protein assembly factor BamB